MREKGSVDLVFFSCILGASSDVSTSLQTGVNPERLQASRKAQKKQKQKENGSQKSPPKIRIDVSVLSPCIAYSHLILLLVACCTFVSFC